jgi:hypothetical protein
VKINNKELYQAIKEEIKTILKEESQYDINKFEKQVKTAFTPKDRKPRTEEERKKIAKKLASLHPGKGEQYYLELLNDIDKIESTLNEAPVYGVGTFRRVVINSEKIDDIKKEIEDFMKRDIIKNDYPMDKFEIKPGIKPGTLVINISGDSATALASKISDIAKRSDKKSEVNIKKEVPLK